MFNEAKLIAAVASACSTIAIIACVIVIPDLYRTINDIHDEVVAEVAVFRVSVSI